MVKNKCDKCGTEVKVCFRSNNKRYKLYICRKCKSKETSNTDKQKVIILDDNELSMACYAEEYPENFKEISESKEETNK